VKLDILDDLKDEELDAVIEYAQGLKKQRDQECKAKAISDARATLAAAGLSLRDVVGKAANATRGRPVYRGGHRYQHPTRKELVWTAKGQKPNWLRQLEKDGSRAVELPGDVSPHLAS
jgi:H-NS histone family